VEQVFRRNRHNGLRRPGYLDHTNHRNKEFRFGDRDLIRMWADENAPTFEFLIENGVIFNDVSPAIVNGGTVPRLFVAKPFSDNLDETIYGSPGCGLVRHLQASANAKGVAFLLRHKMTRILRESPSAGRVLGITATFDGKDVNIQARRGVIIATGGHCQCGVPQNVRSQADRGIPNGWRAVD
jgi:hypothetical protein